MCLQNNNVSYNLAYNLSNSINFTPLSLTLNKCYRWKVKSVKNRNTESTRF